MRLILTTGVMLAAFAALVVCGIGICASRSLGGVWTQACLNEMMGLPDRSDDLHPNPLSGTLPVTPALMARFKMLAELASQHLPDKYSENVEVTALVGLHHEFGWPFTSYEVGAIVYVSDQPPGIPRRNTAQFKVDDSGGSPFQWRGMVGNLLVFFIAVLSLLWLVDVVLIRFARRRRGFG